MRTAPTPAEPNAKWRTRLRVAGLACAALAAGGFLAACGSGDDAANSTTTTAAGTESPENSGQPQELTVAGYKFTMRPEVNAADVPFPDGTFGALQGFDISKDGNTIMTAYSTTLASGQPTDASTITNLLSSIGATDVTEGDIQGQPFTSAKLPDGRTVILAASGAQVAIAVGDDRDQMVATLTETSQASAPEDGSAPEGATPPN